MITIDLKKVRKILRKTRILLLKASILVAILYLLFVVAAFDSIMELEDVVQYRKMMFFSAASLSWLGLLLYVNDYR